MSRSRQPKPRAKPPAAGEGGVAPGGAAPHAPPIGLVVAGVAKRIGRAFDDALAQAGGSRPVWLILLSLKAQRPETQRELAAAVGIEGATLTHHLDGMERAGLVSRERVPENRRVQRV